MANAKNDGVYTLDGARFLIKKGETLPDGAVMDDAPAPVETPDAEATPAATTKDAKSGPSETTEAAAPVETA